MSAVEEGYIRTAFISALGILGPGTITGDCNELCNNITREDLIMPARVAAYHKYFEQPKGLTKYLANNSHLFYASLDLAEKRLKRENGKA